MTNPTFNIEQHLDAEGAFQATIKCASGVITFSVYPDTILTNGLPQIVGYAYPTSELGPDGNLTDDSEPEDALDSDVVG